MSEPDQVRTVSVLLNAEMSARQRLDALLPLVHGQLRASAAKLLAGERPGHTLQATALVHEAYCRLIGDRDIPWAGREHFYAAAGEAMRRILIDHARSRACQKRGGGRIGLQLRDVADLAAAEPEEILRFEEVFLRLEAEDPRAATVVRLRFFAGLSVEQTALALDLSVSTVDRRWAFARAWLFRQLESASRGRDQEIP